MKWLRRGLLGTVVAAVVLALAGWMLWPAAVERARVFLEAFASREIRTPVRLAALRVSLFPPSATGEAFEIGPQGAALRLGRARVRLDLWESLLVRGPAGDVEAEDVWVDPAAFPRPAPKASPGGTAGAPREHRSIFPFPFRARSVRVRDATVRLPVPEAPLLIFAREVTGRTEVRAPERRMSLDGLATDLRLWRGAAELALESAHVRGAHTGRGIEAQAIALRGAGLDVQGGVAESADLRHEFRGEVSADALRLIHPALAAVRGSLRVESVLSGALFDPEAEVRAEAATVEIAGLTFAEVAARAVRRGAHVEATLERAAHRGGRLSARGELDVSGAVPFSFDGAWADLDVPAALPGNAAEVLAPVTGAGRLHASGTLDPLALAVEGDGAFTPVGAVPDGVSWEGWGVLADGSWRAEASLAQPRGNRLGASISLARDGALEGRAEAHVAQTQGLRSLFRSAVLPAVAGAFDAGATVGGSLADPSLVATVTGRNVGAHGLVATTLDLALAYRAGELRLERARASVGGGRVEGAGRVALTGQGRNDWRAELQDVGGDAVAEAVAGLSGITLPVWRGRLSGTLQASGAWERPEVSVDLRLDEARLGKEPFERIQLVGAAQWPEWQGTLRLQHLPGEWVEAQARGRGAQELDASVYGTIWNLDRLRGASTLRIGGSSWLAAEIHGPLAATRGTVSFSAENLRLRGRSFGIVHAQAWGSDGRWRVEGRALDDALRVDGDFEARGDVPFQVEAAWDGADLAALAGAETMRATSSGRVSAAGAARQPRRIEGAMNVDRLVIEEAGYRLEARSPLRARLEDGRISLTAFRLDGTGGSRLELAGGWTIGGDGQLRIDGDGSLAVAELLFSRVQSARGTFRVAADVVRPAVGELRLSGEGAVENASLDFGVGAPLTEARAHVSLAGSRIGIDDLGGHAGGGSFDVSGSLDVFGGPDLRWALRQVNPGLPAWLELELSGRGTLHGGWDELTLAGDVEVERMLYDQPVSLVDLIPWLRGRLAPPADRERPLRAVRLDLHVTAPDELYVDNNVARVEMSADLRVAGTSEKPELAGSVDVLAGQVNVGDRVFTVTGGSVQFRPELGLNPALDFLAESTVDTPDASYTVNAQVSGTADNYRVVLGSADPGLSQTDVAGLVAFGKTGAQMQESGAGFSGADLLSLGVGASADTIERQAKGVLPIDRLRIEPAVSRTTRTFEPRLWVGKDFGEDVTVSVASSLGVETYRTVQAEYRLTPRVSLLASWESETDQEEGAFGGSVKFRREFRRLPRFSLLRSLWPGGTDDAP